MRKAGFVIVVTPYNQRKIAVAAFAFVRISLISASSHFVDTAATPHVGGTHYPAAVELFRDCGLGLFIYRGLTGRSVV
jgi:hypothetical protein